MEFNADELNILRETIAESVAKRDKKNEPNGSEKEIPPTPGTKADDDNVNTIPPRNTTSEERKGKRELVEAKSPSGATKDEAVKDEFGGESNTSSTKENELKCLPTRSRPTLSREFPQKDTKVRFSGASSAKILEPPSQEALSESETVIKSAELRYLDLEGRYNKLEQDNQKFQRINVMVAQENSRLNKKIDRTLETLKPKAEKMLHQTKINKKSQDMLNSLVKIVRDGLRDG